LGGLEVWGIAPVAMAVLRVHGLVVIAMARPSEAWRSCALVQTARGQMLSGCRIVPMWLQLGESLSAWCAPSAQSKPHLPPPTPAGGSDGNGRAQSGARRWRAWWAGEGPWGRCAGARRAAHTVDARRFVAFGSEPTRQSQVFVRALGVGAYLAL
jgi:hypothetical protein